jgi:hypothetical protein
MQYDTGRGCISTIVIALHHIISRSVTLPFSPAAGQFNLPVSGQLMTPHTEPRNHILPMESIMVCRRLFPALTMLYVPTGL